MNFSNQPHEGDYTEKGFWCKMTKIIKRVSKPLVVNSLTLYFALQDLDTPAHAKAVIVAALGYLIAPLDLIPDFKPVIGYMDDALVISKAMIMVAVYIKDEHIERANEIWGRWCD